MYAETTTLKSKNDEEEIKIITTGKLHFLVYIVHKIKVRQFKKYFKFKEKHNLK